MKKKKQPLQMFSLLIATAKSKLKSKKITDEEKEKLTKELFLLLSMQSEYEKGILSKRKL